VSAAPNVAEVKDLCVETPSGEAILENVDLGLRRGETLGVVGESGSGKTTLSLALLHYTQGGARFRSGEVTIDGESHPAGSKEGASAVRGKVVSYVPQNPGTALNPSMRLGEMIDEILLVHRPDLRSDGAKRAAFEAVGLSATDEMLRRYPHQLSGGQQQRVCIALALVCQPPVILLDEPTTGLDVITQSAILEELQRLRRNQDVAMIYVSHDLAVVAQIADRIAVMYSGRIIEIGATREILASPRHPYTQGLLASIPDHLRPHPLAPMPGIAVGLGERPPGCRFAPRCPLRIEQCDAAVPELSNRGSSHPVRCIRPEDVGEPAVMSEQLGTRGKKSGREVLTVNSLRAVHKTRAERVVAAADVNFAVRSGACVALVGESGSGKTTIARAIAGLHPDIEEGSIELDGAALATEARKRSREQRRRIQIVFQNPSDALNPKQTTETTIARPARVLRGVSKAEAEAEVTRLLDLVRLPAAVAKRFPSELSGGERQRVGIARALAAEPELMICDEITSALDVSVQAAVVELIRDLVDRLDLGVLFITHDLGLVATIADEVLVLSRGSVCEAGPTISVLGQPSDEYTSRLLAAAPSISAAIDKFSLISDPTT
jgi:peptide/nickel transport system ATP-binding protein